MWHCNVSVRCRSVARDFKQLNIAAGLKEKSIIQTFQPFLWPETDTVHLRKVRLIKYIKHEHRYRELGALNNLPAECIRDIDSNPLAHNESASRNFCWQSAEVLIWTGCRTWACKMPLAEIDLAAGFEFKCQSHVWMWTFQIKSWPRSWEHSVLL